jgi:protein-disulfide isomerase
MAFTFSSAHSLVHRRLPVAAAVALLSAATAYAQFGPAHTTAVHDATALHPPAGARVAIVEFADMECPRCGADNPILMKAVAQYKIPWVRHDFPLHMHVWSFQAAVNARWFDMKSKKLGDDYRNAVYANQISIYSLIALNEFTKKFAQSHGTQLPFALDPQGKLAALVKADYDLGVRIGIGGTPAAWVVVDHGKGAPYREIAIDMSNLYQLIDQAMADTRGR